MRKTSVKKNITISLDFLTVNLRYNKKVIYPLLNIITAETEIGSAQTTQKRLIVEIGIEISGNVQY